MPRRDDGGYGGGHEHGRGQRQGHGGGGKRGRSGPGGGPGGGGGIPDGLLIGILVFLLGMTLLVWTATGLAGLIAHGSWPSGVTFARTPLAMRHLIGAPHDVTGAWPATPEEQLSGYGLLWGLLIGQLMVLFVLLLFTVSTVARWRARRALQRRPRTGAAEADAGRSGLDGEPGDAARAAGSAAREDVAPLSPRTSSARVSDGMASPSATAGSVGAAGATDSIGAVHSAASVASLSSVSSAAQGASSPAMGAAPESQSQRNTAATGSFAPPEASAGGLRQYSEDRVPALSGLVASSVVLAPPSARRTAAIRAVRDAEGPVLVVTSDPGVWAETKDARAKLGPVFLYDPTHRCDTPARLHWSPSTGCTDRATATERAKALLAPVRPTAKIDTAVADTAETLLRCFLHAAAVEGRQFRHVHRWAQGQQVQDAVRTLRSHPKAASGTAGELEAALTAHPERRDVAQELTARALSSLSSVHIRDSCTPNRSDTAGLGSWAAEGGTLYLVGEAIEDPKSHPGAMPLLTALASSVVEHGRRMAERSSSGRLDPPLVLILEDVAAVAPLPQLPTLLASGSQQGLPTLALLRSREQARTRWPEAELPV